jgi:hypothetical protein
MSAEYVGTINGLSVTVDKVGGGTLGRAYEGNWTVSISKGERVFFNAANVRTGTARTHHEVASLAVEFLPGYGE